jgi:raffinose/stachyose/melibiose transport system substrate-binding protein
LAVGLLAGCSPAGDGRTLTIAVGWSDVPAVAAAFRGVVENFRQANPDITVELEESGSTAYSESITLRAASANPPDAFMLSTAIYGPGFYNLVMGGHLEPLDAYATERGWIERFSSSEALNPFRADRQARVAGTGALYGLPQQRTLLGVYYNKRLLADLNLDVPTTMAEFEASLQAAKDAGIVPMAATKDAYVHNHMILWIAHVSSAAQINDWIYGSAPTFAAGPNRDALARLLAWQSNGWLQEGSIGVSYADAVGTFTGGRALYFVAGPWLTGTVDGTLGADGGFMRMPGVNGESPIGGGPSSPLVISARSQHKAEAVEFLDFFNSQAQSDFLMAQGWGPPGAVLATSAGNPLDVEIVRLLAEAQDSGIGIVPYINWASPTVDTNIYSGLESLLSGQSSIDDYVNVIQSAWETSKSERSGS